MCENFHHNRTSNKDFLFWAYGVRLLRATELNRGFCRARTGTQFANCKNCAQKHHLSNGTNEHVNMLVMPCSLISISFTGDCTQFLC